MAEQKRVRGAWGTRPTRWRWFLAAVFAALAGCVAGVGIIELKPSLAAEAADLVRASLGPRAVAALETVFFQAQDALRRWLYRVGSEQAEAPWQNEATMPGPSAMNEAIARSGRLTAEPATAASGLVASPVTPGPSRLETATSPSTPTPDMWQLSPLLPMGNLEGEGVWQPYLYDHQGRPVVARTFLQPDPARPYALVAIVAFDLARAQLHFVLGSRDPGLPGGPSGDGRIPDEARESGLLLAAFNGGFRTANGMYGAMAGGIVAVPPQPGMATVSIYRSGGVRIEAWGDDIAGRPDLEAWRQNCAPVVQDGTISPRVYNDSIADWGGTVSGSVVTWRSGLGLDRVRRTLYYLAGPSLSMPVLAQSMLAAGVYNGMLLDINPFWVHFTAIRALDGRLVAEPLLPQSMIDKVDRYLDTSPVDFFYVTLQEGS